MTNTTSGKPEVDRRTFLYATAATAAVGVAGWGVVRRADAAVGSPADLTAAAHHAAVDYRGFCYAEGDPAYGQSVGMRPRSVRKNASRMSRQEIRRFSRAYRWAVAKGYFDVFNDEHFNHMRNRHHGADVLAVAPPAVFPGQEPSWGFRLLPWHRSFLLEAEAMLRAALQDRNRHERGDPGEADRLFLPYWDATHDQDLPRWSSTCGHGAGARSCPRAFRQGTPGTASRWARATASGSTAGPAAGGSSTSCHPPTRSAGSFRTTTSWASTRRSICSQRSWLPRYLRPSKPWQRWRS